MDDDLKIHPEWEKYTPKFKLFANELELAKTGAKKLISACPFAHLF